MVDRFTEKAGAGDSSHTHFFFRRLTEGEVAFVSEFGDVKQDIICPLRNGVGNSNIVKALLGTNFVSGYISP